jgi:hypothetical protein
VTYGAEPKTEDNDELESSRQTIAAGRDGIYRRLRLAGGCGSAAGRYGEGWMTDNVESLHDPKDPDSIEPNEFTATLRVMSTTLPLDAVTHRLGPPTRGHSVGDPQGRTELNWQHTVWLREASGADTALEPLIEELVTFAESRVAALAELRRAGCRVDLTCSIFPGTRSAPARIESVTWVFGCGVALDASLMRRIAALDLDLDIGVGADLDLNFLLSGRG